MGLNDYLHDVISSSIAEADRKSARDHLLAVSSELIRGVVHKTEGEKYIHSRSLRERAYVAAVADVKRRTKSPESWQTATNAFVRADLGDMAAQWRDFVTALALYYVLKSSLSPTERHRAAQLLIAVFHEQSLRVAAARDRRHPYPAEIAVERVEPKLVPLWVQETPRTFRKALAQARTSLKNAAADEVRRKKEFLANSDRVHLCDEERAKRGKCEFDAKALLPSDDHRCRAAELKAEREVLYRLAAESLWPIAWRVVLDFQGDLKSQLLLSLMLGGMSHRKASGEPWMGKCSQLLMQPSLIGAFMTAFPHGRQFVEHDLAPRVDELMDGYDYRGEVRRALQHHDAWPLANDAPRRRRDHRWPGWKAFLRVGRYTASLMVAEKLPVIALPPSAAPPSHPAAHALLVVQRLKGLTDGAQPTRAELAAFREFVCQEEYAEADWLNFLNLAIEEVAHVELG